MKISETIQKWRGMEVGELRAEETKLKEELVRLRLQYAIGQLDNTARLPQVRANIARVKTVLQQKLAGR